MKAEERDRFMKMAGLVLIDALAFQEVLAGRLKDRKIPTLAHLLSEAEKEDSLGRRLQETWDYILSKDYEPIFELAKDVLVAIPASPGLERGLRTLVQRAYSVVSSGVLRRHDLMGRLYHRLLFEETAKHYATYYTSVPAAVLLARLALTTYNPIWKSATGEEPWGDLVWLRAFRVMDLACGSGTLLSAVYNTLRDEYTRLTLTSDQDALHQALLEEVLWGCDVLPYAVHLAATALALHNARAPFVRTHLYSLPLTGRNGVRLGSLDFLERETVTLSYLSSPRPVRVGVTETREAEVTCPKADLVIMNPPFARSSVAGLLFGSFPPEERGPMQTRLRKLLHGAGLTGVGQAGLAAPFVAVGDKYLNVGGRLALVLPRAFLSGVAWRNVREMLADRYQLEYVLTSYQAPNNWNFSENTDLSEVLLVCRKLAEGEEPGKTLFLNLWRKPSATEAIVLSSQIVRVKESADISGGRDLLEDSTSSAERLILGRKKIGEAYTVSWEGLVEALDAWGQLCPFAQGEVNRTAYLILTANTLYLPAGGGAFPLPLKPLGEAKEVIGPDVRQVTGSFSKVSYSTPYKAVWGYGIRTISCEPNAFLDVKSGQTTADGLWVAGRGKLLIAGIGRVRLNTLSLFSLYLPEDVLSNIWWPVRLKPIHIPHDTPEASESEEKIQALWLNTTVGVLSWLSLRQDTEGPWVQLKKETLQKLPVLNLSRLSQGQLDGLVGIFERFKGVDFPPLPKQYAQAAEGNGVRFELDKEVLKVLIGHDIDLKPLCRLLAQEPILTLQPLA